MKAVVFGVEVFIPCLSFVSLDWDVGLLQKLLNCFKASFPEIVVVPSSCVMSSAAFRLGWLLGGSAFNFLHLGRDSLALKIFFGQSIFSHWKFSGSWLE